MFFITSFNSVDTNKVKLRPPQGVSEAHLHQAGYHKLMGLYCAYILINFDQCPCNSPPYWPRGVGVHIPLKLPYFSFSLIFYHDKTSLCWNIPNGLAYTTVKKRNNLTLV